MPPEKRYFFEGKYYKHSQYYALMKKERQKEGDKYRSVVNEITARETARDELMKAVLKWDENDDTPGSSNELLCDRQHPLESESNEDAILTSSNVSPREDYDFSSTNFTDADLYTQTYLPAASSSATNMFSVQRTPLQNAVSRLHTIFVVNKATTRLQTALLKFMKEVPSDVLKALPLGHRSLRSQPIDHIVYDLPPGRMLYFGIRTILAIPDVELFDRSSNEICLSVGIDGLPLFNDAQGVNFWPILAAVLQYPVFLIGLYGGKSKPTCPNAFIRPFVKEVKQYEKNGLLLPFKNDVQTSSTSENCGVKVYRFRLHNLIMDLPALAYITCIIGHAGGSACPKCTDSATSVILESKGLTKDGKIKKGCRYTAVFDAAQRTPEDFLIYLKHCLFEKLNEGRASTDCCMDYTRVREYDQGNDVEEDELFCNAFEVNEEDEFDEHDQYLRDREFMKSLQKHHSQDYRKKKRLPNPHHVSILILLSHFNIVDDVPVEYMHAVCIGVVKIFLERWYKVAMFKMSPNDGLRINGRLLNMRDYFPAEFQRKPESLEVLSSWKATQYRTFLLYIGAVALRGILRPHYLQHFYVLVTAMRTLVCKLDNTPDRSQFLQARAKKARTLLQYYVKRAVELYGGEVATLKLHLLLHISDDYLRFGPLDEWSAFRFESFLGRLKKLIHGHTNPVAEVVNSYSSLLQSGTFGKAGNRGADCLHEYYEEPEVKYPLGVADETTVDFRCGHSPAVHSHCGYRYKRLYVKSFVLRVDNKADSCCVVDGNIFLNVREIFHNSVTRRTYLCGHTFDVVGSLFSFVASDDEGVHSTYESREVGMLKGRLSTNTYTCEFGNVNQKVCAVPLMDDNDPNSYALLRFLH